MSEKTPKTTTFETVVVRPIENAYLVEIVTDSEDLSYSFKSYRQVLRFLKDLEGTEAE